MVLSKELFNTPNFDVEPTSQIQIPETYSQEERAFAAHALERLLAVAKKLETSAGLLPNLQDVQSGLQNWLLDKAHGAQHSYAVFQREKAIRDQEVTSGHSEYQVNDDELELRAILHDLGEFLPVYDENQVKIDDKAWQFRRHAQIISFITRKIGQELGIEDAKQLALDLRNHDFYWSRPSVEVSARMKQTLSPAGQLLADGDRLVGDNVQESIARSRSISLGKWYFLRELAASDRALWKVRTGAIFDGMSAVLTEFSGQDHWFYTETGKDLNHQKQEQFRGELKAYYQAQYRTGWEALRAALSSGQSIEIGVKGEKDDSPIAKKPEENVQIRSNMSDSLIKSVFSSLLQKEVPNPANPQFPDRKYFGYSVRIDGKKWVDPSILRFENEESLAQALDQAVDEYQAFFANSAKPKSV